MKKREALFINIFHSWIRANPFMTGPYEFKQTSKSSIPFSSVEEHQVASLIACKSDKGFFYKISDESRGHKPFDGFYFRNSPAYIVIRFPKSFEIIDVEMFVRESKSSIRRSLTAGRAKEISIRSVSLR